MQKREKGDVLKKIDLHNRIARHKKKRKFEVKTKSNNNYRPSLINSFKSGSNYTVITVLF